MCFLFSPQFSKKDQNFNQILTYSHRKHCRECPQRNFTFTTILLGLPLSVEGLAIDAKRDFLC